MLRRPRWYRYSAHASYASRSEARPCVVNSGTGGPPTHTSPRHVTGPPGSQHVLTWMLTMPRRPHGRLKHCAVGMDPLFAQALSWALEAAKQGKTSVQLLAERNAETSRQLNAGLPEGLRRSGAQMDHTLNCPLAGAGHVCGEACGYPGGQSQPS